MFSSYYPPIHHVSLGLEIHWLGILANIMLRKYLILACLRNLLPIFRSFVSYDTTNSITQASGSIHAFQHISSKVRNQSIDPISYV